MSADKKIRANAKKQVYARSIQLITPHLWFDNQARDAAKFYTSIFPNSRITNVSTIRGTPSGDCDIVTFELSGQTFMAISAGPVFKFNESISFIIKCTTQEEIDFYWEKLSAVPEAEQCGWLKDKFGLSWQVVPAIMDEMMKDKDEKRLARVTEAFLKMKKFDIGELERAYAGQQQMNPVVHFELPAEDRKRMAEFYTKVFDWKTEQLGEDMGNYVLAATTESDENGPIQRCTINGGFFQKTKDAPIQHPSVVIAVQDIKQHMKKVEAGGGKILGEPLDIPGIGQYVAFVDTEGNKLSMLQPTRNMR